MSVPLLQAVSYNQTQFNERNRSHRILIVDDEVFIAVALQEGLEKLPNCEVVATFSGEEALHLFQQQPFDLLITDYQMPGMNGVALVAQIRRLFPQTETIIITAYGDRVLQETAMADLLCLSKPVKLAEIRSLTLKILSNKNDNL